MKLSVIIPVYNEEATIQEILKQVRAVNLAREIIVVDDGSTDGTRDLLKQEENQPGTIVIYHGRNQGKGAAVRTGFDRATGDILLIQDADLEYDPRDYAMLIRPIVEGRVKVVYGSRFLGPRKAMMFWHMLGNKFLTLLTNVLYNAILSDMETCYKVFRADVIRGIPLRSRRFEFEQFARVGRPADDGNALHARQQLLQHRQPLGNEVEREVRNARSVDARSRPGLHDPGLHHVAAEREHHRRGERQFQQRSHRTERRDDEVRLARLQRLELLAQTIRRAVTPPGIKRHLTPFDPTHRAKTVAKRHQVGRLKIGGVHGDPGEPRHAGRRALRLDKRRPSEAHRRAKSQPQNVPSLHDSLSSSGSNLEMLEHAGGAQIASIGVATDR